MVKGDEEIKISHYEAKPKETESRQNHTIMLE